MPIDHKAYELSDLLSRLLSLSACFFFSKKPILIQRRPEMDTDGFYGDTFSNGFGKFYTARRK